jgi:hypothetical protein
MISLIRYGARLATLTAGKRATKAAAKIARDEPLK